MSSETSSWCATGNLASQTAAAPAVAREYLSFSAIRTYQACPLKYYFRYVLGLPEARVAASLVFGGAVHAAIEEHFRQRLSGTTPDVESLLATYRTEWRLRADERVEYGQGETPESLERQARAMLSVFLGHDAAQPAGRILGVEETLRAKLLPGVPEILGRVDLVRETDESLVIADWKTSRSRWAAEQFESAAEQLVLYTQLAHEWTVSKPFDIELVVLTKTALPQVQRHVRRVRTSDVTRVAAIVARVWRAVEAGHFYPAPSTVTCGGCPYRGPCRAWCG
ncbi:MAG: PD-(D/E)XK nuclease family protein [Pirellulales bacterium]